MRTTATGATPTTPASLTGFTNSTTYVTGSRLALGPYTVTTFPNPLGDFLVGVLTPGSKPQYQIDLENGVLPSGDGGAGVRPEHGDAG